MRTRIRITPEVSPAEFDEMVMASGGTVELPDNRAGWAFLTLDDGRRYKTWVSAPQKEA